jgi:phenylacetate-coenzyme A ligase PaaK-like adenylate-forming protein
MSMLQRDDLRLLLEERLSEFVGSPPPASHAKEYGLRVTSGTTGGGPFVLVSRHQDIFKKRYSTYKSVLGCFGPLNIRLANALFANNAGADARTRICIIDINDLTALILPVLGQLRPDHICGFPSFIARTREYMDTETAAAVTSIDCIGERLTGAVRMFFKDAFPNAALLQTFVISEVGQISSPACGHLPLNCYHPPQDVLVEINEPDETGAGALMVSLTDANTKIERYVTGDVARFHDQRCACGAQATFELLGRAGFDYIKLNGAILRREEFDRVLGAYTESVKDYQAEASTVYENKVLMGKVRLRILPQEEQQYEALADTLQRAIPSELFVTPTRTYADLVQQKVFLPLEVEIVQEPFPAGHKSVKLRHIG